MTKRLFICYVNVVLVSRCGHFVAVLDVRPSVHQAAKLVAAVLKVARVTAGLAESNGSLPPGL